MRRPVLRSEADGGAGAHVARRVARAGTPAGMSRVAMSPALRIVVFGLGAALWISGVLWLVLHLGYPQRTSFGPLPNPWEAALMRVHGLLAVGGVFLLGWLAAGHVLDRWARARRLSGVVLAGVAALLIASGYALYYSTGALHEVAAGTHRWLGAASLAIALAHWWRRSAGR